MISPRFYWKYNKQRPWLGTGKLALLVAGLSIRVLNQRDISP